MGQKETGADGAAAAAGRDRTAQQRDAVLSLRHTGEAAVPSEGEGWQEFPEPTTAALAKVYPLLSGEGQRFVAKRANDAIVSSSSAAPEDAEAALRALDNALLFAPLLDAVSEAHGAAWRWDDYASALNWALQYFEEGSEPQGDAVHSTRVSDVDYMGLRAEDREQVEAFVLAALLAAVDGTPLDDSSLSVTRANLMHAFSLAQVAAERRTLDPEVIESILRSPGPPLGDGAL